MTPIVGDVIESVLKNTIGKGVDALIGKYLPTSMSESERENLKLEFVKAGMEQYKAEADIERIGAGDRDSARKRDVELKKSGYRNLRQDILAYTAVGGFFICLYVMLTRAIPDGVARDIVFLLIGLLIKIVSDIYGYDFGSSSGSAQKTHLIDRLTR